MQQDASFYVTALVKNVSGNWQTVEPFIYDPYSIITVLDANWLW